MNGSFCIRIVDSPASDGKATIWTSSSTLSFVIWNLITLLEHTFKCKFCYMGTLHAIQNHISLLLTGSAHSASTRDTALSEFLT